jgi:DNA-binding NtrC family response regulator
MELRVLLVDDDPALAEAIRRQLRHSGYSLRTVGSAEQALAALEAEPADVLVSDEQMPGMSGVELLSEVATRWPTTVSILMTGHATAGTVISALNHGRIHRCLLKPCPAQELDDAIKAALAFKLSLDRCEALMPLFRRQRDLLAVIERLHPGLLTRIECEFQVEAAAAQPDGDPQVVGPTRSVP